MEITGVHTPAMIDDGGIAADFQWTSEDHFSRRRRPYLDAHATPKINAIMVALVSAAVVHAKHAKFGIDHIYIWMRRAPIPRPQFGGRCRGHHWRHRGGVPCR